MKFIQKYKELNLKSKDEVFDYLLETLKHSNRTFEFFIDWAKVFNNVKDIEINLNMMNYLIGKENIESEFKFLIQKYPKIVSVIPILIAIRKKSIEVLYDYKSTEWEYKEYSFRTKENYSEQEIENIVEFCKKIGLLDMLTKKRIKNLVDYCIGLEVGIGTNGRKNRSGTIMEKIIEFYLNPICKQLDLEYIPQATYRKVKEKWGIDLPIDKTERRYDFAINKNDRLILIEVNFYSGGGSKLKSVAGEYIALADFLRDKKNVEKFIWITDGIGWKTAKSPLREAFENMDFLINTRMISEGILEEIIKL